MTQHFENIESALARLAAAEARIEERLAILKETMSGLARAEARTDESFERLSEAVARGFTRPPSGTAKP